MAANGAAAVRDGHQLPRLLTGEEGPGGRQDEEGGGEDLLGPLNFDGGYDFGDQDREMYYDMEGVAETAATVPGVVVPAGTGDTTSRRRGRQPKIETEEEIQGKKRKKAAVEMIRRATKKTAVSALPTPERERTQGEERRKVAERKRASRAISNR